MPKNTTPNANFNIYLFFLNYQTQLQNVTDTLLTISGKHAELGGKAQSISTKARSKTAVSPALTPIQHSA